MDAFWAKGFEATSISDLCNCTGLHKGSLYQAFGDKHTLFMNALKHYADSEFHETTVVLQGLTSPLEIIRVLVNKICDDASGEKGCMMINSVVELAPHDPAVKSALQSFGEQRMNAVTEMIANAQEAGEISIKTEPYKLARHLMMTMAGGAAMVKGLVPAEEIKETMNELIDSWV
jgi:TetR/AcrR family transcriptional repressor of nem operon